MITLLIVGAMACVAFGMWLSPHVEAAIAELSK